MAEKDKSTRTKHGLSILVAGPECSGKTALCSFLSEKYHAYHLNEYAVTYLNELNRKYNYDDILAIAKNHYNEYLYAIENNNIVFLDSFLLNLKIWSLYRFGKVDHWILDKLENLKFDLVLLLEPNLTWEMSAHRENPNDRYVLYDLFVKEMQGLNWEYKLVNELGEERYNQAVEALSILIDSENC